MSSIYSFFLSILHFLALTWATIHPAMPPRHLSPPVHEMSTRVRVEVQRPYKSNVVLASVRTPDAGYWHTSGSLILDDRGRAMRIEGINWYGFETVRQIPGGLTVQDYRTILDTIRRNGFNTVRIPLSNEMVERPIVPSSIGFANEHGAINEPLRGLTSVQILDRIVEYAGSRGLKVILDNHRSEAGDSAEQSGLWFTEEFPETAWIADWQQLARRYGGNSTVIGFDLRNEPHNSQTSGACWDCGGGRDWHLAAERAGNAILAINPRLIIFVEGVDVVDGDSYWWGGNLQGARRSPVRLTVPNQLVYSPHTYGPKEYQQRWFNAATTPASLETVWMRHWAFISQQGIAPVWVGEFGTGNRTEDITGSAPGSEGQWFQSLVSFLGRNPKIGWTSWALNGEDSNGLLNPGYDAPANLMKMQALTSIMSPTTTGQPAVAAAATQINSPAFDRGGE